MHACALERPAPSENQSSTAWMELAACRGLTALFYPPQGEQWNARERREAAARELCRSCPVLDSCRRWARDNREYGFWGGESEEDRAAAGYCVLLPVGRKVRAMRRQWRDAASADDGTVRV